MGIQHAVKIQVNASFNEKNVLKILRKGVELGFIYRDYIDTINYVSKLKNLSDEDATIRILMPCSNILENYGRILVVKHYDVFFHMFFFNNPENTLFELEIGAFGDDWKKTFLASGQENHDVKYQRFIKTALDLCSDFCIKELKTEAF